MTDPLQPQQLQAEENSNSVPPEVVPTVPESVPTAPIEPFVVPPPVESVVGTPPPTATPLKQIRTFQGDVAQALGNQKESLFSIQQSEGLKRASGGTVPDPSLIQEAKNDGKRKEFILLTLGSFVLIGLGLVGAWYGYQEFLRKTAPPIIAVPENRFIGIQSEMTLNVASSTRDRLFADIALNAADVAQGELMQFVLRKGSVATSPLLTTSEFFQLTQTKAPSSLVRAFDPLFMLGTLGQSRFLIIKLSSFENAFAGMLSWEKTLAEDLGPLFATAQILQNNDSQSVFSDVTLRNKDARAIFAPTGLGSTTAPVLLYSFFDNQMLIITDSAETLKTIVDRLTQELLSR